ncbi:Gamma-aminobutyric acid receptor subunit beta-like protein, partial [Dinothrombium tinctorium]
FQADFYLRQTWTDNRLRFDDRFAYLSGGQDLIDKLWIPDTFFPSDKKGYQNQITVPNAFVRIYQDGKVFISQRFLSTITCDTSLAFFPMDRHSCKFIIES